MSANTFHILKGNEVSIEGILGKSIVVIGYGNQGAAHAKNLKESGCQVAVCTRHPDQAIADGFDLIDLASAGSCDLIILAIPDEVQQSFYEDHLKQHLKRGVTLGFIHGFAIHYNIIEVTDDIGVVMVAPKGPGKTVRDLYTAGKGIPSLVAIHKENSTGTAEALAHGWAAGIGSNRAGIIQTTFKDETETDLFGEQAIIVGGMVALMNAAFETLVEAGYPPELAYIECCHEVKQVADLVYESGLASMFNNISNTAEFGAYEVMDVIDDEHLRKNLRTILMQVQNGNFAQKLVNGLIPNKIKAFESMEIERIGHEIRSFMNQDTD